MSFDEVRTQDQAKRLEEALKRKDGEALLLIFADWCGHCTTYKPLWKKLAQVSNGVLTAAVHYDQVDNVPALKDAKLNGYPTVIRVKEDGSVETIDSADMRDEVKMKMLLKAKEQASLQNTANTAKTLQSGLIVGARQRGGSTHRRKRSLRPPVSRKQRRTRRKNTRRARRF